VYKKKTISISAEMKTTGNTGTPILKSSNS